jgi:hypothetical protein
MSRDASGPGPAATNGTPNGWARLVGLIGVPGAIAFYLIWWLTQTLDARLARIIALLEQIARAVNVSGP